MSSKKTVKYSRKGGNGKNQRKSNKGGSAMQEGVSSTGDDKTNRKTHNPRFRLAACMEGLRQFRNVFPSSWRTSVTATITGQIAIGGAATRTFEVDHGGIYFPFDTTQPWPTPLVGVTAYQPAGYNALMSSTGPYVSYRTFGSAISVMITPLTTLDACTVLVFPTVAGPANFTAASQGRWVKKMEAVANERNVVTNAVSMAAVSGDSPLAIATSDNFAASYNATPTLGSVWEVWLNFATTNAAAVLYTVTVVYDVVFENPEYDLTQLNDVKITPKIRRQMNLQKKKEAEEQVQRKYSLAKAVTDELEEEKETLLSCESASDNNSLSSTSSASSSSSSSSSATSKPALSRAASGLALGGAKKK